MIKIVCQGQAEWIAVMGIRRIRHNPAAPYCELIVDTGMSFRVDENPDALAKRVDEKLHALFGGTDVG